MKKILLLGSGEIGIFGLKFFLDQGHEVFVLTGDDDIGKDTWKPSLLKEAKRLGVPADNPSKAYVPENFSPKSAFSLQYSKILSEQFIEELGIPIINIHTAPLPELRGVDTCAWAIIEKLPYFGITVHIIDKGVDTGPIIDKHVYPILPSDTTGSLYEKNNILMKKTLTENLSYYLSGHFNYIDVSGIHSRFHKKHEIDFSILEVDTSSPIEQQDIFIRSRIFPQFQLPFVIKDGKRHEIVACTLENGKLNLRYKS